MRSAMRSADMPGPGSRFGHEVTMRHFSGLRAGDRRRGQRAGERAGGDDEFASRGHDLLHCA